MINNFFDLIKNITYIKDKNDLGTKLYNCYMINRFLSMDELYIPYSVFLNRNFNIPVEYQEKLLFYVLPKKYKFFKYIKNNVKFKESSVTKIKDELNLSDKKSNEILEFMNKLNNVENGLE
jgi:hypothetical protein